MKMLRVEQQTHTRTLTFLSVAIPVVTRWIDAKRQTRKYCLYMCMPIRIRPNATLGLPSTFSFHSLSQLLSVLLSGLSIWPWFSFFGMAMGTKAQASQAQVRAHSFRKSTNQHENHKCLLPSQPLPHCLMNL